MIENEILNSVITESALRSKMGKRLRAIRRSRKLSVVEVSSAADVARITYYQYETGRSFPSIPTLRLICTKLRVSIDYVLCLSDNPIERVDREDLLGVL